MGLGTSVEPLEPGPQKAGPRGSAPQGWGLAALGLGSTLVLASGLTHVIAWQYVSLAGSYMGELDTRLGLAACVLDALLVLGLGVLGVVAGTLGVRESRRLDSGQGLATAGLAAAVVGMLTWLIAAANLMIVAIARLH